MTCLAVKFPGYSGDAFDARAVRSLAERFNGAQLLILRALYARRGAVALFFVGTGLALCLTLPESALSGFVPLIVIDEVRRLCGVCRRLALVNAALNLCLALSSGGAS